MVVAFLGVPCIPCIIGVLLELLDKPYGVWQVPALEASASVATIMPLIAVIRIGLSRGQLSGLLYGVFGLIASACWWGLLIPLLWD